MCHFKKTIADRRTVGCSVFVIVDFLNTIISYFIEPNIEGHT